MKKASTHFKTLSKDLFTYGFMGALDKGIAFLLLPVFTRIFSTSEYGIIDSIAIFSSLVSTFIALALPSALVRYFHEDDKIDNNEQFFSTLLYFTFSIGVLICAVLIFNAEAIANFISNEKDVSTILGIALISMLLQTVNALNKMLLRIRKKIVQYSMVGIIQSILYAVLALTSVLVLDFGITSIFLSMLVANFLSLFIGLYLNRKWIVISFRFDFLKTSFKYSLPMFPSLFVTWGNNQVDRLIILNFVGLAGVGIYGAGFRINKMIEFAADIFKKSWLPFSMEIIKDKGRNYIYSKTLTLYAFFFGTLGVFFMVFSIELVEFLIPPDYHEAIQVIPWLIGASIINGAGNLINLGTILSEKTIANSIASWTGFLINLILTLVLVREFGIKGAALGTFVASLVSKSILWLKSVRLVNLKFKTHKILLVLAVYIVASLLTLYIGSDPIDKGLGIRALIMMISLILITIICIDSEDVGWIKSFVKKKLKVKN